MVFSLALKDDGVEQYILWIPNVGSKAREGAKAASLRLYCWIFSMRVPEEERSVRDGV